MKRCSKCRKIKSLDQFHKRIASKDGLHFHCKLCRKEYCQIHKVEIAAYLQAHKVYITECVKKYRQTIIGHLRYCFSGIKYRCNNPKYIRYKDYGGRGIKCLFKSSNEFINYIINELQIDPRGLQIDRINNDGNYEPGNIRFVTAKENCNNRKRK